MSNICKTNTTEVIPMKESKWCGKSEKVMYLLDITEKAHIEGSWAQYNAAGKPRMDTVKTFCEIGTKLLIFYTLPIMTTKNKWKKSLLWRINKIYLLKQAYKKCKGIRKSIIFVQYPFISCPISIAKLILKRLQNKGNKFIFVVHDIESIRHNDSQNVDKEALNFANVIIVHTPQMANILRNFINETPTVSLEYFDYHSRIGISPEGNFRKVNLIFAGNLRKASFINNLSILPLSENFQINLYGAESPLLCESKYVHYKGRFNAEEFGNIEGNWGLVWDGDSIETCSGEYGQYLRLNAPFKFSLYLAACRPVIVWRESAMAQYVEQQHLGICVDSLSDIPNVISCISDDELNEITKSVEIASQKVKKGYMLQQATQKALNILLSLSKNKMVASEN